MEPQKKSVAKSKTMWASGGVFFIGLIQGLLPDGFLTEDQLKNLLIAMGPIFAWLRKVTKDPI